MIMWFVMSSLNGQTLIVGMKTKKKYFKYQKQKKII